MDWLSSVVSLQWTRLKPLNQTSRDVISSGMKNKCQNIWQFIHLATFNELLVAWLKIDLPDFVIITFSISEKILWVTYLAWLLLGHLSTADVNLKNLNTSDYFNVSFIPYWHNKSFKNQVLVAYDIYMSKWSRKFP